MPGLLRGVARTAVVAGTATAVSNRVSRRQANRWAEQAQPEPYQQEAYAPPPEPAPAPAVDYETKLSQLTQLGQLRDAGVLSDAEFEMQKSKILNS